MLEQSVSAVHVVHGMTGAPLELPEPLLELPLLLLPPLLLLLLLELPLPPAVADPTIQGAASGSADCVGAASGIGAAASWATDKGPQSVSACPLPHAATTPPTKTLALIAARVPTLMLPFLFSGLSPGETIPECKCLVHATRRQRSVIDSQLGRKSTRLLQNLLRLVLMN